MRLNRRQGYFRTSDEMLPEKRMKNWGKYIYFFFIWLILIIAGYYLVNNFIYAEGNGQIIFDKLYIQHTRDLRVINLLVKEGDQVKKQQALFTYVEDYGERFSTKYDASAYYYSPETEREIARAIQSISLKEIEIKGHKETLEKLKTDYQYLKKQAILDAQLPGSLKVLQENIRNSEATIGKNYEELKVLRDYLNRLKGINSTTSLKNRQAEQAGEAAAAAIAGGGKEFISMQDGVIARIYPNNYEVVQKGDTIIEIYKPSEITIKAFFEQKYIDYLRNGVEVMLQFPDGTRGKGVVKRYYLATQPQPPEFQKRYEPVNRNIVVDILPPTKEDANKWESFYKLSVKVFVNRLN
ncbi:MAG: HlyD family efflux transporter periplasmic adaptor subunit [Deltaproteobacteria bacterium]